MILNMCWLHILENTLCWDQLPEEIQAILVVLSKLMWNRDGTSYMGDFSWDNNAKTAITSSVVAMTA